MGLDMFIFKHKRFENATLDDVMAVEYYLDLEQYKKEHPDCKYTMEEWCGKQKPADNLIEFFGKFWTKEGGHPYEEVAYWRKANQIHRWFVQNVQDGADDCMVHRELTRQDLLNLLDIVSVVLRHPTTAKDLLPTQSGFSLASMSTMSTTSANCTARLNRSEGFWRQQIGKTKHSTMCPLGKKGE